MERRDLQWLITGIRLGMLRGIDTIMSILPEKDKPREAPRWGLVYSWRNGDFNQRVSGSTGTTLDWEKLGDPLPERAVGVCRILFLNEERGAVGEYYGARIEESFDRDEYPSRPYSRALVTVEVYTTFGYDQCGYCGYENRGIYPCPECYSS